MARWSDGRTGRHLSLQVPSEIKCMLIKRKALSGACFSFQICEALKARWERQGLSPVPAPGPESVVGSLPVTLDGLFPGR